MSSVEIEEAAPKLVEAAFDAAEFPFAFLEAFGNKPTTIKILRNGHSNKSDVDGSILQRNRTHLTGCETGRVSSKLTELRDKWCRSGGRVPGFRQNGRLRIPEFCLPHNLKITSL